MLHGNAPASVPNTIRTPRFAARATAALCAGIMKDRAFGPSFFSLYA